LLQRQLGGRLGSPSEEYLGHTVQGAMRMKTLLQDLRTYMQISATEQESPEDVDAGEVFDKALANFEIAIKEGNVSVTRTALPRVRIYEFQLAQVFQNLIANAIRYHRELPPRIHIAAERQGAAWQFSVQDNGIGIEPQYKERIFGMFQRLHTAAEYPGTGMGLAICKRIIERAGGRIWVESEFGKGSTFFFTVPLRET
jgi:light-regulated signal transduction histidine kinase (bacteriophytochrome)